MATCTYSHPAPAEFLPSVSGDPMARTHETPQPLDVQVQQVARMG